MNLWGAAPLMAAGTGTSTPSYRVLPVTDYLGIPAAAGLVITLLSLGLSVWLVRHQDRRRDSDSKATPIDDWLERPILGSGAWTANDSWATNISTGLVVVGSFIAVIASPSGMFPNIALDRFALANVAAGFFVAAAPVVFGILYSQFTAANPGLTADATVKLLGLSVATIAVPSGATVTIAADTAVQDDTSRWAVLRAGGAYQIPVDATIKVVAGVHAAAERCVTAAEAAIAAAAPRASDAAIQAATEGLRLALERALAIAVAKPDAPAGGPAADDIEELVAGVIDGDSVGAAAEQAVLAANADDVLGHVTDVLGPLTGKTRARVKGIVSALKQAARVFATDTAQSYAPSAKNPATYPALAYSGTADIGVLPGSVVLLSGCSGQWTVAQADVLRPAPPADTPLKHPVLVHADSGVKVTVTGAADITLGPGAVICAPQRAPYSLPKLRRLMAPQGTNLIVANVRMVLAVNILTMFGIGAELGIAGVLAALSSATAFGKGWIYAALAAVAVLAIWYAATATRTVADPQPGSSLSAEAGTSFTL
jgi:hypothetical protein